MFRYEIPKKVLVDILCGEDVARGRVRLFYQSLEARLELRSLEIPISNQTLPRRLRTWMLRHQGRIAVAPWPAIFPRFLYCIVYSISHLSYSTSCSIGASCWQASLV
jgi:hypothetical protein